MADTGPDKMVRRDSTLAAIEGLSALDQSKVKEYVDDDLLSCFIVRAPRGRAPRTGPGRERLLKKRLCEGDRSRAALMDVTHWACPCLIDFSSLRGGAL
mmetsp:Transcript_3741/g.10532  ORF Transcript_3741/g.10532 Transcript_3741/m.10532 type:complete len:99 (+) Transcript_3741:247-543(+)